MLHVVKVMNRNDKQIGYSISVPGIIFSLIVLFSIFKFYSLQGQPELFGPITLLSLLAGICLRWLVPAKHWRYIESYSAFGLVAVTFMFLVAYFFVSQQKSAFLLSIAWLLLVIVVQIIPKWKTI